MKKIIALFLCLLMAGMLIVGCGEKQASAAPLAAAAAPGAEATPTARPPLVGAVKLSVTGPGPRATAEPVAPATAEPVDTAAPQKRYTFQPKVMSSYLRELFGDAMCETWFSLVDAVMAGETTFACPDDHTYGWVMGQFPDKCLPPLYGQIEPDAPDPDHPVRGGVGRFRYVTSPQAVAVRIETFARKVEGILNRVFEADDTDFEKCFALYKYFCDTYRYDYASADRMKDVYLNYLSSYRLFTTGQGICCEIAVAYAYLLMQAGVDAGTMGGHDHDWAYVKLNGRNYHIDPTFALGTGGDLAYFLMDDEQRALEGYPKAQHIILSNYAQDHPHPDYMADDDSFRPLWSGFGGRLDRDAHVLRYRVWEDDGLKERTFDYEGY